jgi:transcriptional regulator with XRE-family HTH domain
LKEDARKLFAMNLKVLVERDGYSRAGLASYLSVPVSMVSRWLQGKILPTKHLESIAEYLDVSIGTLFRSDFSPLPSSRDMTQDEAFRALAKALGYSVRRQTSEK